MAEITTEHLTEATLSGGGVFDELMRAAKAHLQEEYSKGRIKGPEYATVYLGAMTQVMQQAITFLLERQRADAQAELLKAQAITEGKQQALLQQQTLNAQAENDILIKQLEKVTAEITHLGAQTAMVTQQTDNLVSEKAQTEMQTELIQQQRLNAIRENEVMEKQICKLQAEYDVLMETKLKTVAETALLTQKNQTEKAQTIGAGVDADSVVGRQKALYLAQADGFKRDAEQKAAKVMVDSWNVRRTTDEGVQANNTNKLDDSNVGKAVTKLLSGVGA